MLKEYKTNNYLLPRTEIFRRLKNIDLHVCKLNVPSNKITIRNSGISKAANTKTLADMFKCSQQLTNNKYN